MNRKQALESFKAGEFFDVLVVGGGATGSGVALDAASRGLKTALVEMRDFAEGTSSKSTKMVHGGVRYLEKAVKRLDKEQWSLVKEGLHERSIFLKNAPHIAQPRAFVTPLYRWIDVPQVFIGLKLYDWLSGKWSIGPSGFLSRRQVMDQFPMINKKNLKAAVTYYDGQFNDSRMTIGVLNTAVEHGAAVANDMQVTDLLKEDGRVVGVKVTDLLSGEKFEVKAKCVVNATGPFTDGLRKMDDKDAREILKVSSGIHISIDRKFAPQKHGLMIPATEDGRVLFVVPWEDHAVIGTTDDPCEIHEHPEVSEKDIEYVLRHINKYFDMNVTRADVKAVWSGLRPLVMDPNKPNTQELARTHVIVADPSGMITISGGKWTSFRRMAEDTVDEVVKVHGLTAGPCKTEHLPVIGGAEYQEDGWKQLVKDLGIAEDIARHLNQFYGDRAAKVAEMLKEHGARLHPDFPYTEADVLHGVREEMAIHAADILFRRLPLGLVDFAATEAASDRVIELMAGELGWDDTAKTAEKALVEKRMKEGV